jgi:hypothetical protein
MENIDKAYEDEVMAPRNFFEYHIELVAPKVENLYKLVENLLKDISEIDVTRVEIEVRIRRFLAELYKFNISNLNNIYLNFLREITPFLYSKRFPPERESLADRILLELKEIKDIVLR